MTKTAIIDADSFIYIAAWNNRETEDFTFVAQAINDMMVEMIQNTKATHYLGVFTPKKTFRNDLVETYKANRPPTPEWVTRWKQQIIDYCVKEYGFVVAAEHEADDVLSIMQGPDVILCHIDKDINQVPGEHYDYKKKTIYEVDESTAEYNFWYQVLVGDSVDNIKGAWKVGPVNAAKILSANPGDYSAAVRDTFKKKNGEDWITDYNDTIALIRLLEPDAECGELREFYKQHIQKVEREVEVDLVESILNHDRVLEDPKRSHESDVLRPPADIS